MTTKKPAPTFSCDMAAGPDLTSVAEIVNSKVINVRHLPRRDPLTKKSEVLQVLKAGGLIVTGHRDGLWQLLDAESRSVPAWQTALKAALKATQASSTQSGDTHEPQ
ncbi:TPA: hypothetical protein UM350_004345 [Stenotrophomonas maltophilia]|uniref:hypothetical protein n=1 Tax=Stenotrophomonas maltophilia TaxID=40324 RepID=UPI000C15544E|nr:hypothetical protein [Stenotrophomonas maltophilia]MBA0331621.1 hypothetical protein [Stenotrophomonas maltophilia]MBN5120318.1 hypothetical protein [Stenotrophomonas maltophilia]MBO3001986.1 hypothetical protein [Stenotrophomonas maltophilia]MBP1382132.1 hypothetical protein [Stenotrophomonas maltophilia]MBP1387033.1 hypothetical protein [Stenotrophomonas maltophilia]